MTSSARAAVPSLLRAARRHALRNLATAVLRLIVCALLLAGCVGLVYVAASFGLIVFGLVFVVIGVLFILLIVLAVVFALRVVDPTRALNFPSPAPSRVGRLAQVRAIEAELSEPTTVCIRLTSGSALIHPRWFVVTDRRNLVICPRSAVRVLGTRVEEERRWGRARRTSILVLDGSYGLEKSDSVTEIRFAERDEDARLEIMDKLSGAPYVEGTGSF